MKINRYQMYYRHQLCAITRFTKYLNVAWQEVHVNDCSTCLTRGSFQSLDCGAVLTRHLPGGGVRKLNQFNSREVNRNRCTNTIGCRVTKFIVGFYNRALACSISRCFDCKLLQLRITTGPHLRSHIQAQLEGSLHMGSIPET